MINFFKKAGFLYNSQKHPLQLNKILDKENNQENLLYMTESQKSLYNKF